MEFEWDPAKSEANLRKHGIDFEDAAHVLLGPHVRERSDRNNEKRWIAVGEVDDRIFTVVYTLREGRYRIRSARRARANEREKYREKVG